MKSIIRCVQEFSHLRMAYFDCPSRPPTAREAAVEAMLAFLNSPSDFSADYWDTLSLRYIGCRFTAGNIRTIGGTKSSRRAGDRVELFGRCVAGRLS